MSPSKDLLSGGNRASGLHDTFLLLVVVFAAGGGVTLFALRTYERDVATANASA